MKIIEQQIKKFKEETGITLKVKDGKPYYNCDLDLRGTGITALPDNLTVKGCLDLSNTRITSLPDNLTVGYLNISSTGITDTSKVNRTFNVDFVKKIWEGKPYICADGIFTRVINHHGNVWKVRKINGTEDFYLITDGEGHYAHGKTIKEAKADLIYKTTRRNKSEYKNLTRDSVLSFEEAIKCYRTITGACNAGTKYFVESCLDKKDKKDSYTIKEISELTKGRYGNKRFMEFFHLNKSFE